MNGLQKDLNERFSGRTIVIVGDLVADQFLNGTISRVSREAPVFILRHDQTVTLPGAAANAAANVAALGGRPVLIGLVGYDANGELLMQVAGYMLFVPRLLDTHERFLETLTQGGKDRESGNPKLTAAENVGRAIW